MEPLSYVISKKAISDLEEIWLYTSTNWSIAQADRYYSLIIDEIDYISKNVNTGKLIDHIAKGYRTSKVKSHVIVYRVVNDAIQIVRILHERMDVDTRLIS